MYKLNEIKIPDIIITTILTVIITIQCYSPLYKICSYGNLPDFYIGTSIYQNHNKYLDTGIYFLYLFLFFLFLPLVFIVRKKFIKQKDADTKTNMKIKKESLFIEKIKSFCLKYQYFCVLGYIFLHPFDENFYYKIVLIILALVLISFVDIYKRNKETGEKSFSPFAIAGLLFLLFFYSYNTGFAPSDDHHFGEKFAVFFLHDKFNLAYYKDIILVHGLKDIIPSWLGANIFNQNNIYGYCLGEILLNNLTLIFIYVSSLIIFKKAPFLTAPLLCIKVPDFTFVFIFAYLFILKKTIINKPYLSLGLYFVFSFFFISIWTTIGSFWAAACLPYAFYSCYKIYNSEDKNKFFKILLPLSAGILLILLFHSAVFEFFKTAQYYIKGNLYAFGNNFADLPVTVFNLFPYICKTFVLLFIPVLIIEFIKQIKKSEKDIHFILFLIFSIIFPVSALSYMLGRIDNGLMQRLSYFSIPYLVIILPYFLYKLFPEKYLTKLICIIIILFSAGYQLINIPDKVKSAVYKNEENSELFNTGNISLIKEENKRITDIKEFVYKNGENAEFLDLTNSGMLYLYLNKKIPIQYISFYNSISTLQGKISAEKIIKNPPDIILIKTKKGVLDFVFPSLRVNSLYKAIIKNGHYKLDQKNENVFLVKNKETVKFNQDELDLLDSILSNNNLNFLPEVWANSLKTLPMKKFDGEFYSYIAANNEIVVKFIENQNLDNFDLIYVETGQQGLYTITLSGSNPDIVCKTKTGKILVPLDNYPSWLLNENIKEIRVNGTLNRIEKAKIEFYKRGKPMT